MKMFLIQKETVKENFLDFVAKGISVPKEKLFDYYDGNSIAINKHYFTNFYNTYFKKFGEIENLIKRLEDNDETLNDEIFKEYQIGIYIYNILD